TTAGGRTACAASASSASRAPWRSMPALEALRDDAGRLEALGLAPEPVARAAVALATSLGEGGKLLVFGNGGSAADAQHIAAELVGRFELDRAALPAVALTTDTSALTAIGNDFG